MNWLAHLHLAGPGSADRVGSILPDLLSARDLAALPGQFRDGIDRHRQVDSYTDTHPVFLRSKRRIDPPFRRYAGILVDVFYDHILATDWDLYAETPLPVFAADVYKSFDLHLHELPVEARARMERMRDGNLFCAYRDIVVIREVLQSMSARLRRPFPLDDAVAILEARREDFRADFREFFPDVARASRLR